MGFGRYGIILDSIPQDGVIMPTVKLLPYFEAEAHGVAQVQAAMARGLPSLGWKVITRQKDNADIIHVHALIDSDGFWDVYTSHGYFAYPNTQMERNIRVWQDRATLSSRSVTSVCEHWAKVMRERFGSPVEVIPNGFWPDVLDGIHRSEDGEYVVWAKNNTDNLTTLTGYHLALEVARQLPDVQFYFSLSRPKDVLPKNVKVIGLLPRKEYLQLIANSGAYFSSCREAFSLAVVEAMALGTPVVGVNEGGNAEAVESGISGILESSDVNKLAKAVEDTIEARQRLGEAAKERAYKKFTWQTILPQYVSLYERVLEERRAEERGPKLTFVITAYNMGKVVRDTVDSALNQKTEKPFEVIVVNDGSTDDTAQVLEQYKDKVRLVNIPNGGVSSARNLGISLARSAYITCLDGDDRVEQTWVDRMVGVLDKSPLVGMAYTDMRVFGSSSGVVKMRGWDFEQLKRGNYVLCCNAFRKKAWAWAGGYKQIHPSWEDYDLWLSIGELGWEGVYIPEPLFHYRMKEGDGRNWESQGQERRLRAIMEAYHPKLFSPPLVSVMLESSGKIVEIVQSVLAQTVQDFEVLVWDGDGKAHEWLVNVLHGRYKDPRVKVLSGEGKKADARKWAVGKVVIEWFRTETMAEMGIQWFLESRTVSA